MRRLPIYPSDRINAVYATQAEVLPGAKDELLADTCAEVLTHFCGDDVAVQDASRQVLEWMQERRARGNWMEGH